LILASDFLPSIISSFQIYAWGVQNNDIGRYFQVRIFKKMNELDIGTVEQPEVQNMILLTNSKGLPAIFSVVGIISSSFKNITALIISAVALIVFSPLILVIILVGTIPTYFIAKHSGELTAKKWKENAETARIWRAKTDPLLNKNALIELKNFDNVTVFNNKFLNTISVFHEKIRLIRKDTVKNEFLGKTILTASLGISLFLLIKDVYAGNLAVGALVFSFSVIGRFQRAADQIFDDFGQFFEHKKNVDIAMDFFELESLLKSGKLIIDKTQPITVELKNVSFAYPGSNKNVLENISLKFSQGDNIAIVGLNGAGKTTLIKLLTRVYDPTEGEILVNKIPLKEYDLESWKQCLGILLQEYTLYSEESIAENIMLGDISKHEQEIVESSAKETTANEFIEALSDKYNQKVGTEFHGGVELSKGQKQKLALSRVLYRNAPIVVLDEPTASVDALSEDTIFRNLKVNHNNQTRIIISHKFSNVRDADQIILIEHGKIIEEGSHEKLMKKRKGKYKELFNLQAEGYR
jgi:ABC-type multidrug transport system fused ATPase/permease subunit